MRKSAFALNPGQPSKQSRLSSIHTIAGSTPSNTSHTQVVPTHTKHFVTEFGTRSASDFRPNTTHTAARKTTRPTSSPRPRYVGYHTRNCWLPYVFLIKYLSYYLLPTPLLLRSANSPHTGSKSLKWVFGLRCELLASLSIK